MSENKEFKKDESEAEIANAVEEQDLEGHSVDDGDGDQNDTFVNIGCC